MTVNDVALLLKEMNDKNNARREIMSQYNLEGVVERIQNTAKLCGQLEQDLLNTKRSLKRVSAELEEERRRNLELQRNIENISSQGMEL